jgi:FkbM family methyltransferase
MKQILHSLALTLLSIGSTKEHAKASYGFLYWARHRFGQLRGLWIWLTARHIEGIGTVARVPLEDTHVLLRIASTDNAVYDQVFLEQEYRFNADGLTTFILDAGAHIGLASLYFARRYPLARIIAIEPDRANWRLARLNTEGCNVTVLRGALWNREAHLAIANPDGSPWGYRVVEDLTGTYASKDDCGLSLPGFTIEGLRTHYKAERIDIFKMDIEGSEVEVLPTVDMSRVGVLACETHDNVRPGCSSTLREVAAGWRRDNDGPAWDSGVTHVLRRA